MRTQYPHNILPLSANTFEKCPIETDGFRLVDIRRYHLIKYRD